MHLLQALIKLLRCAISVIFKNREAKVRAFAALKTFSVYAAEEDLFDMWKGGID